MTTSGIVTATYLGLGPNNSTKNYTKQFAMQPVTGATPADEVVSLIANGTDVVETYATVTKGLLLSATLAIDVPFSAPAAEAGAWANRAAAVQGTIDGSPEKKWTAFIQAARDGIFVNDSGESSVVDTGDTNLTQYFSVLNSFCLVSDGEVPHEDPVGGYRVDRKNISRD